LEQDVDIKISGYIFTASMSGEGTADLTQLKDVVSEANHTNFIKHESHKQRQKQQRQLHGILVN
jgi:hypothetical protein